MRGRKSTLLLLAIGLMWGGGTSGWAAEQSPAKEAAKAPDIQKEVVARVGERVITLEEFNRVLPRDPQNPQATLSPAQKKAHLERWVHSVLFHEEAKRLRLQERPEVAARIEEAVAQVLIGEYLRLYVAEKARVEESEVKAYWEAHPQEFTTPLQVRARHLLVATSEGAEAEKKARRRAEEILARVRAGEDFAKLAAELSEDAATKEKGGDLGFFAKGKMAPEFEAAAFAAKAGEAVGPVKTTYGFHLIKVEEIREPILRPFEVVKQPLQKRLVRERQQMLVSALLKEIKGRIPTETNIGLFDIEE